MDFFVFQKDRKYQFSGIGEKQKREWRSHGLSIFNRELNRIFNPVAIKKISSRKSILITEWTFLFFRKTENTNFLELEKNKKENGIAIDFLFSHGSSKERRSHTCRGHE
ncbi:hypothetical protein [Aurantibacter sp.]|uniref:hypothetical protein n=1 Tax=Aurantibacter sp. TaxID=2807103 RepID=UPI003264578E